MTNFWLLWQQAVYLTVARRVKSTRCCILVLSPVQVVRHHSFKCKYVVFRQMLFAKRAKLVVQERIRPQHVAHQQTLNAQAAQHVHLESGNRPLAAQRLTLCVQLAPHVP